jgi:hypothetical protein
MVRSSSTLQVAMPEATAAIPTEPIPAAANEAGAASDLNASFHADKPRDASAGCPTVDQFLYAL